MTPASLWTQLKAPGFTPARVGVAIVALVVCTALVLASITVPTLELALREPPGALNTLTAKQLSEKKAVFAQRNTLGQDRVTSRWPFYPPPPRVVAKPEEPKPLRYAGPALIAMVNNTAWFADGTRLKPGDPAHAGLEVIELQPPWGAKVRWQGGEFSVSLFEREPVKLTGALDDLRRGAPGLSTPATRTSAAASSSTAPRPTGIPAAPGAPGTASPLAAGAPSAPASTTAGTARLPGGIALPAGFVASGQPQTITLPDGRTGTMQVMTSGDPAAPGGATMMVVTSTSTGEAPAGTAPTDVVVNGAVQTVQTTPGAVIVAPAIRVVPATPASSGEAPSEPAHEPEKKD